MNTHRIAVIPGDGIGKEVVPEGLRAIEAARIDDARNAHRRLATSAAELRQPLYHHFSAGWEVVWAQMAGRVADAERLAREAYELGRRAHARDADVIYAAQTLILRRREDALQDFTGTIEGLIARVVKCVPHYRR